jgi:hypothetical protein
MLTRMALRAAVAAAAAMALVLLAQVPALAGGSPSPGSGFGFAQCGQSASPTCTITAGTGPAGGTPGAATASGSTAGRGGPAVTAPGAAQAAQNALVARPAIPVPAALAQMAVKYLRLPDPVVQSSPAPAVLQLTRLPVWLWVPAAAWQPQSKTATVPGESVTATATPVSAAWSMGDGTTVTCTGPGTPYTASASPAAASPTCGYTYGQSSAGQPGGAYRVTVTVTWDITWTGTGGAGGALPPLRTAGAAQFRVAESQALNTSDGG